MLNWSDLLPDLLKKITGDFTYYEDFISFLCVCTSWRSLANENDHLFQLLPSRFPCLMLGDSKTEEKDQESRKLLLLSNGGMIRMVKLPEACGQLCISTRGWLLTTGEEEFAARLLHPLSRVQIDLPELYMFSEFYCDQDEWIYYRNCMKKVVFTSPNPLSDDSFRVNIVWGNTIGICRLGDGSWTRIDHGNWEGKILDITYHNTRKRLYAVATMGAVYECDVMTESGSCPPAFRLLSTFPMEEFGCPPVASAYLLEWGSDSLLMITRELEHYRRKDDEYKRYGPYRTKNFQAFVLDLEDGNWSKLESLGSRAMFVGSNSTFSVDVSDEYLCPVKANCIYFTDDLYEPYRGLPKGGGRDVGVYHLSNGSIEPLFIQQEQLSHVGPCLWLESSISPHVK